jgi:hypothetical protein
MRFTRDDGGRAAAGFKGKAGDCVVRSIAIATGLPYAQVHKALFIDRLAPERYGVPKDAYDNFLSALGWIWVPTMRIGQGCKVHLRDDELPMGRLVVSVTRHLTAVIDGVIHDNHDPSRGGTRCVYGYWRAA